ncbi:class I adenylate-forming enzyme family protein [Streptomyces sp. NPDC056528]|uniref:class I adenylate-forming enzyme family protein n=1 Tax=Streptomyces sp. NPDC056528 TaxID=3345854 RepID=UPI00367D8811
MSRPLRHISRHHNPFPQTGVSIAEDRIPRYDDLPPSLVALLHARATQTPSAEAVAELGGERLTYRQLWDRAATVAGGLREAGIARGDRVAVRYSAGVDWVLGFFGTILAGGIAVTPNTRSTVQETRFVLDDAGVSVDLAPGTPLPSGEPYADEELGLSDPAAMFYTSGTTGSPKGVPTTHEGFLTNAENMVRVLSLPPDIGAGLRTLISIPLFHVTGCNSQLLAALYVGGAAVIMPALDQAALIEALGTENITLLVTVPAVYSLMLRNPGFADARIDSVRWVGYGGAAIAPTLVAALQKAFPRARVFNGYGMTETAALMTVLPHDDAFAHADSVGYAVPTVELAIVPLHDDPDVGELVARGANVMSGYWNRPGETASALKGGWMHTGDIVRVDHAGRIHIIDRLKDIIIRGGENVSSLEVEAVLAAAPTVLEAAVLAVPDDVMGEKVGAVLFGESVDVDAVISHCRENLADFKVPQFVHVSTTPLPRNAGGKLLKAQLRETTAWGAPLR